MVCDLRLHANAHSIPSDLASLVAAGQARGARGETLRKGTAGLHCEPLHGASALATAPEPLASGTIAARCRATGRPPAAYSAGLVTKTVMASCLGLAADGQGKVAPSPAVNGLLFLLPVAGKRDVLEGEMLERCYVKRAADVACGPVANALELGPIRTRVLPQKISGDAGRLSPRSTRSTALIDGMAAARARVRRGGEWPREGVRTASQCRFCPASG